MTRDQITTLVTKTVGQEDATSVSLCNDYVQRAYEMVWNAELWRDTVTIDQTATTSAGTNTVNLPSGFERVVSVQLLSGGTPLGFLDPTTATILLQTNPTALTVQGVPTAYEEFVHTDGVKKIRLFPIPNATYTLMMVGKRACPVLTGSDSIQIRNVDNAVIAFVMADMYTKLRHLAKAAEMAKKGGAALESARVIEVQGSNQPRRANKLTVSGDSLDEMVKAVCSRCNVWTEEYVSLVQDFLRRNYKLLWDAELWPESVIISSHNSDGRFLVLPEYFDRVIAVRPNPTSNYELSILDAGLIMQLYPQLFEEEAAAIAYSTVPPVAVHTLPVSDEKLTFVSSSASDKTDIFVRGESVGVERSETVTLNGTTPVDTVYNYEVPLTIAKTLTTGTVSVTGKVSLTTFQTLLPAERERKHMRLLLYPAPGTVETALVVGKRKITPLVSNEDTPALRNAANVLIYGAVADMFDHMGKPAEAENARKKSAVAMQVLKDGELKQNARQPRVVPSVESYYSYSENWLVKG